MQRLTESRRLLPPDRWTRERDLRADDLDVRQQARAAASRSPHQGGRPAPEGAHRSRQAPHHHRPQLPVRAGRRSLALRRHRPENRQRGVDPRTMTPPDRDFPMDLNMQFEFSGEMWPWRGPAPYHFVTVPGEISSVIGELSSVLTYGWGVIP